MSPRKKISYKKTNSTVKVKKPTHKLNNIVEKLTKVSESPAKKSTSFKMSPGKKISYKKTNSPVNVKIKVEPNQGRLSSSSLPPTSRPRRSAGAATTAKWTTAGAARAART